MATARSSFYDQHGLKVTLLGSALLPFVVAAALTALRTNANEVKDWLPPDYAETAEFHWFRSHFPNDEFVLVTWDGCTLDDPRLDRFAERVERHGDTVAGVDPFPRVVTGRTALRELQNSYQSLSRDEAIEKLIGALVGPDGLQTCAIVSLTDESRRDVHGTLAVLRRFADETGLPPGDVRMGGPLVVNAAIDRVSAQSLYEVVVVCCVVASVIAWWLIRNLRLMVLILVTGLYASALSLAVLWLTGTRMNAILTTMIPMVYVTATSGAIHLCNYYLESVREGGHAGAADRAVAHARLPLGLATATTAAGLLSICYTDLVQIRSFGIYSAIGVALSWVLLVLWLPAALAVWRPSRVNRRRDELADDDTGEAPLPPFWRKLGEAVVRRPNRIAAACLLVWAACIPGLWRLSVSIDFMKEFRDDSDLIRTYVWLEEKLGPLMPMEVVLRIDESNDLTLLQRVRLVERLQRRFESHPEIGGSISVATYVPEVAAPGPKWMQQGIRNRRLEDQRDSLRGSGYLAEADGEELWRITVRVVALREVNYAALVAELRRHVEEELDSNPERFRPGVTAVYTGVAPVLYRVRRSLVDGLFWGVTTDLLLIVLTVAVLMRHWSSGLLMTLISLFPTIIVLGATGLLDIQIDLGAIMAPCVALGVTVDDVIHFLLWFRTGIERGMHRREAVLLAWRACVRPMYQSWTLLGLGMACLAVSEFLPILLFGMVMTSMLTVGLVGNVILLPALLSGPLGEAIARRTRLRHEARRDRAEARAARAVTRTTSAARPD